MPIYCPTHPQQSSFASLSVQCSSQVIIAVICPLSPKPQICNRGQLTLGFTDTEEETLSGVFAAHL